MLKEKLVSARKAVEVDIFVTNGSYYPVYVDYLKKLEKQKKLKLGYVSEGYGDRGLITIIAKPKTIREVAAWEPELSGYPMVQFLDLPEADFSVLKKITPRVRGKFIEMNSTDELQVFLRVDGDKTTFDRIVEEVSGFGVTITSKSHISDDESLRSRIPVSQHSGMINVRIKQIPLYQILTVLPEVRWVDYHRGMGR